MIELKQAVCVYSLAKIVVSIAPTLGVGIELMKAVRVTDLMCL